MIANILTNYIKNYKRALSLQHTFLPMKSLQTASDGSSGASYNLGFLSSSVIASIGLSVNDF